MAAVPKKLAANRWILHCHKLRRHAAVLVTQFG
jgi:hypothetical protein